MEQTGGSRCPRRPHFSWEPPNDFQLTLTNSSCNRFIYWAGMGSTLLLIIADIFPSCGDTQRENGPAKEMLVGKQ